MKGCGCPSCSNNKRLSTEEYISILKEKCDSENILFDKVEYINNHTPITLICKEHGEWNVLPTSLLNNIECPECQKKRLHTLFSKTLEQFIKEARTVHGNKYDYSKVNYIDAHTKICIICPEHGEFWQTPINHLKGNGCPKCKGKRCWNNRERMTTEKLIAKFSEKHGDKYDYSRVIYKSPKDKIEIICRKHGSFFQLPYAHLNGQGCPLCAKESLAKQFSMTTEDFIKRAKLVHGDEFIYYKTNYVNSKTKVCITCKKHGDFWQNPMPHLKGIKCPMCYAETSVSKNERDLQTYIKFLCQDDNIRLNARNIIHPLEIDIVNETKKTCIEYNGLYWHSTEKLSNINYHLNKTNLCQEKGYQLIHIFEDEWIDKRDIVKSKLEYIFNKSPHRINAKNCVVREVSQITAERFLKENSIQYINNNVNSINYGLFYNNELIYLMALEKKNDNIAKIINFCNKCHFIVIDSEKMLINFFIKEHNPKKIIVSLDKRWHDGKEFFNLGFAKTLDTEPSFYYTARGQIRKREVNTVEETNCSRIYDCGEMILDLNIS